MTESPFGRILVALDGSRLAEQILPTASSLVQVCSGELLLLHVLEAAPPERVHGEPHLTDAESAGRYLERLATELRAQGIACRIALVAADHAAVARCIARQARALEADTIALTTHGRGGLRGFLVGRIAQQVLQEAELPTLVRRALPNGDAPTRAPAPPHRVLVPLDGSHASAQVLPLVWQLATCLRAHVTLARIVPTVEHLSVRESAPAVFLPSATAALLALERERAEDELRRSAATAPRDLAVSVAVHQGDVIEELVRLAEVADLVVMTTHGRAGLPGWMAGSVAARLLERVVIPFLLVPLGERSTPRA
ncbi:MAG: universal stress protein [Thermomicrobium sp.]|nr:universal stress protein [Thermomicrobium sp.]